MREAHSPATSTAGRAVMRQRWSEVLFLHWALPPSALRGLVPPGLDLDTFEGRAYVGLVPFTMTGVRPVWAPPFRPISDFHETNVRTYVRLGGRDPGVWFFSLDAASRVAVMLGRTLWKLPYHFARMSLARDGARIRYASERSWPGPVPAACRIDCAVGGAPAPAEPGTLEHFLVERYVLYARSRTRLYQGRVHHEPYPLQPAFVQSLEEGLLAAAGIARPEEAPLAHFASEARVEVLPLTKVLP